MPLDDEAADEVLALLEDAGISLDDILEHSLQPQQSDAGQQATTADPSVSQLRSLKTAPKLAMTTMHTIERSWASFFAQLEPSARALLPGSPTDAATLFTPSSPHIDYATASAYLLWWASNTRGKIEETPTLTTALQRIDNFSKFYAAKRGQELPVGLTIELRSFVKGTLIEKGLLSDVHRELHFIDAGGYFALARACFSPYFAAWDVRDRWQALGFMAIDFETLLRVGSLANGARTDAKTPSNPWACWTLNLSRTSKPSFAFKPLVGKNETSRETPHLLTWRPEAWRNPVLFLVVLAIMDDALPCTLEQVFNPAELIPPGHSSIALSMNNAHRPVFRQFSAGFGGESADMALATSGIGHYLAKLSAIAGLPCSLLPHAIRWSGTIEQRLDGKSLAEIAGQLTHRGIAILTRWYLRLLPGLDIGAAVFQSADKMRMLASLHPNCLRPTSTAPFTLPPDRRRRIYTHEPVVEALEAVEEERQKARREFGNVTCAAAIARLDAPWRNYCKLYRAFYAYELQSLRYETQCTQGNLAPQQPPLAAPLVPTSVADYKAMAEQRDLERALDLVPEGGGACGFDAIGSCIVLCGQDMANLHSMKEAIRDWDNSTPTAETVAAIARKAQHEELQDEAFVQQLGHIDPSKLSSDERRAVAVCYKGNAPSAILFGHDGSIEADATENSAADDENERDAGDLVQLGELHRVRRMVLFDSSSTDPVVLVRTMLGLPKLISQLGSYRPGEVPVAGKCTACGMSLFDELWKDSESRPLHLLRGDYGRKCVEHVRNCYERQFREKHESALLSKYHGHYEYADRPFRTQLRNRKAKSSDDTEGASIQPSSIHNTMQLRKNLEDCLSDNGRGVGVALCMCGHKLYTVSHARYHLLADHGLHLTQANPSDEAIEMLAKGEWNTATARFQEPQYCFSVGRYVYDPLDRHEVGKQIFKLRFHASTIEATPVGVRTDIEVPLNILSADSRNHPADSSSVLLKEFGAVRQEGFCMLCVHDERKSWMDRMRPYNDRRELFNVHIAWHLHRELSIARRKLVEPPEVDEAATARNETTAGGSKKRSYENRESGLGKVARKEHEDAHQIVLAQIAKAQAAGELLDIPQGPFSRGLFIHDEAVTCPHLRCRQQRRQFPATLEGLLELCQHLVACHCLEIWPLPKKSNAGFRDICFANTAELDYWLRSAQAGPATSYWLECIGTIRAKVEDGWQPSGAFGTRKPKKHNGPGSGAVGRSGQGSKPRSSKRTAEEIGAKRVKRTK